MNVAVLLGKKFGIYLAAIAVTYLLATASASWHVANRLVTMGVEMGLSERIAMILHDLAGMAGMFLPLIAFGLLLAFLVTALLHFLLKRWQTALYVLAGAAAMICLHLALNLAFSLTPVAVARSGAGLAAQGLAGAVGGWVYIALNRRLQAQPFREIDPAD
jgi:hypothetical protein